MLTQDQVKQYVEQGFCFAKNFLNGNDISGEPNEIGSNQRWKQIPPSRVLSGRISALIFVNICLIEGLGYRFQYRRFERADRLQYILHVPFERVRPRSVEFALTCLDLSDYEKRLPLFVSEAKIILHVHFLSEWKANSVDICIGSLREFPGIAMQDEVLHRHESVQAEIPVCERFRGYRLCHVSLPCGIRT
jgi:hypothetical protein